MFKPFSSDTLFIFVAFFVMGIILHAPSLLGCGISYSFSWVPPETNQDGSPLTDLAGYKFYYGTASESYTRAIDIGDDTTCTVDDLAEGVTYYFAVTAYDSSGNESAYSDEIEKTALPSNRLPAAEAGGMYSGTEGQAISLDASGSGDPDGNIVLYEWDIDNDGVYEYRSSYAESSHTYARQGLYAIKLRVTDNRGGTGQAEAVAYISDTAPAAAFTGDPARGTAPITVAFSNSSYGYDQPLQYEWDFDGNGTVDSTLAHPSYTYPEGGTYTVKLTVIDGDGSSNTLTRTDYVSARYAYTLGCHDGGNIECLVRKDGGSDSDNLTEEGAAADLEYEFRIQVKDPSGRKPQNVTLYMTQRNYPAPDDFYGHMMSCSGKYDTGALCTYMTKLGPAEVHTFYFDARFSDGTVLRYPDAGYITGPEVQLSTGYNFVGIPRDIRNDVPDSNTAFGTRSAYRWDPAGFYTRITGSEPVKAGEGYYIRKETDTLPELAAYAELHDAESVYELKPGWNLVSNPYSGIVEVSDMRVRKGARAAVGWTEAVVSGWTADVLYYKSARDGLGNDSSEYVPQTKLVPWIGYWIYLYQADDAYFLVISRPPL